MKGAEVQGEAQHHRKVLDQQDLSQEHQAEGKKRKLKNPFQLVSIISDNPVSRTLTNRCIN